MQIFIKKLLKNFPTLLELLYGVHFLDAVKNRVDTNNIRPMLSNDEKKSIKGNIQRMLPLKFSLPTGTKFGIEVWKTSEYRVGWELKDGKEHKFDGNKVYLVCELFGGNDVIKTLIWKGSPTIKDVQFYVSYTDILRVQQKNKNGVIEMKDLSPFIKK